MLKTVLLSLSGVVVVGIAVVLILAARKPDTFQVTRTVTINAPPERVYPLIADFKAWGAWSPWEKKDPAMKRTYGATAAGKGATYAWDGDKNVGSGSMEIMDAPVPSRVTIKLAFKRPFEANNVADFTLVPVEGGTNVSWSMSGPTPFFGKILHVFVDMDKMVGRDFEAGLANLKAIAEK
jgi:uncharacterized protein YndB with AHSA1/START domain